MASDGNAFFDFLFRFHHLDGKGGVDNDTLRLGTCGTVIQNVVKDAGGILFAGSAEELFGLCGIETQRLRTVNPFVIARHNFEFVREGNFVVAIETVDYRKVDAEFVKNICVESHLCKIGHTEQLVSRLARIDKRAKKVEQCTYSQCLAHRTDELHCRIEKLGVQVGDVTLVHAAFQLVGIIGETDAVLLHDIACPTDGSGTIIAVFGNFVTGSGHHKTGTSGNVERVLSITSRTYDIDRPIRREVDRYSSLHKGFAKAD